MPRPAITRVPNLSISPSSTNKNNGFYAPQLTTVQRDAIPANTLKAGAIIYNTTINTFQIYTTYIIAGANATTSVWSTLGMPVMTQAQGVFFEAANNVVGQIYVQSDQNIVRVRNAASWRSIATV